MKLSAQKTLSGSNLTDEQINAARKNQNKARHQTIGILVLSLVLVITGVFAFVVFYNNIIDSTLYGERLNQMREVTSQLFSGLEDVIKNQWRIVGEQTRTLQKNAPKTMDSFLGYLEERAELADMESYRCNIVAVGDDGWYYTQNGRQGLIAEREYLLSSPERISFVSNSITNAETRMVFLQKLEQPIVLRNDTDTITLTYYGISQNMEELNPYFETTLNGMSYLHGTSLADTMKVFTEKHIAYSNAMLGDTELYYSIFKMDNSAWSLIFLVPSSSVATNTVELVGTTIKFMLGFASVIIAVSLVVVIVLMRIQQKAALAAERENSKQLERLNSKLIEASKAKSEFLSNMSHDIRTPMNAIVGMTKLIEHDKDDPDKLDMYVEKIQTSSHHLLSLINDVLDMSKIESGEVTLNRNSVSLADEVVQVENIMRP
ncbi:MAG: hypothetical protein J6A19_06610 [Oscillospiraceae bacterium]|nr:hypothetical protein [Oscillospiraceae bacterium]